MSIILQHPSAPVPVLHDPREQPTDFIQPTQEEMDQLDAMNGLSNLIERYGAPRVMRWVRLLAHVSGEEV